MQKDKLFFFDVNHSGNYNESVDFLYQIAGFYSETYEVYILHEKDDYKIISYRDYPNIKHMTFKQLSQKKINITATDVIFTPESYIDVIKNLKENKVPATIVLVCMSYSQILLSLSLGDNWLHYNIKHVIVPNESVKEFCQSIFPSVKYHTFNQQMQEMDKIDFSEVIPLPTIVIGNGMQGEVSSFVNHFFLKYPQYSFIPIRTLNSGDLDHAYIQLKESSCLVLLDSSVSDYQIAKMAANVDCPVLGIAPQLPPQWLYDENGYRYGEWTSNYYRLVDMVAQFIESWLTDTYEHKTIDKINNQANTNDFVKEIIEEKKKLIENKTKK